MRGAELISRAITGNDRVMVSINGKMYVINSPTIDRIAKVGESLGGISTSNTMTDMLYNMFNGRCLAKALSALVNGDYTLTDEFAEARLEDVAEAVESGLTLISADDWDKKIGFDKERNDKKTETAGNATLLGQIASFMENLHLSYHEVVYEIPYRNLLVMQKDKLHTVYGTKIKKGSGKDMAKRRKGKGNE